MELRFWTDAETGLPHIFDHGVTEDEVEQVLSRPGEEHAGTDHSRIRLGQTEAGRYPAGRLCSRPQRRERIRRDGLRLDTKGKASISPAPTEKKEMNKAK